MTKLLPMNPYPPVTMYFKLSPNQSTYQIIQSIRFKCLVNRWKHDFFVIFIKRLEKIQKYKVDNQENTEDDCQSEYIPAQN